MIVIDKDNKNLVIPNGLGNINRDYQEGYEAGYQESFEEGKAEGLAEGRAEGLAEGKAIGIEEGKQIQKDLLEAITITENGTYNKEDGYNQVVVDVPDLNGDYQTGYDEGYEAGEVEQKSKLTNITIYENGTYTREDGYNEIVVDVPDTNGSYDEGYADGEAAGIENAGAIIAETARVLDITENGFYLSKYSDPIYPDIITGVYPNGENFYSYAYVSKRGYNTNIYPSPTTKIEFWWRFDGTIEGVDFGEGLIIGAHTWGYSESIFKIGFNFGNQALIASIYDAAIEFPIPDNNWHHYIMSFEDGLVIDGEQIGEFGNNLTETSTYEPICINGYYGNNRLNADDFGMVIVDGTIYIPTAVGFMNYTTNEYLPIVRNYDGSYTYTQIKPEYINPTGNLIKTVNVNVVPKINVAENGIKFGFSTFTEVPDFYDFSNISDMSSMFNSCGSLQTIPLIDTSKVTDMTNIFTGCISLQTIPALDTSNVTNMSYMFSNCTSLISMPELDTSNVIDMNGMINNCSSLTSIPALQAGKLNMTATYVGIFGFNNLPNITDFGGFIGLKYRLIGDYNLNRLTNLNYQSCINVLNGLYDFTGNGETPTSEQGQLKVHPNFLTAVGDEISIAVAKGWIVSA